MHLYSYMGKRLLARLLLSKITREIHLYQMKKKLDSNGFFLARDKRSGGNVGIAGAMNRPLSTRVRVHWFVFFLIITLAGCSTTQNYAPVRPYQRDLVNSDKYYIVKQGDTLYSIGFRSGHGYKRLSDWNKIPPPYILKVGRKIKLFEYKQRPRSEKRSRGKKTVSTKVRSSSQKTSTNSNNNKKVLKLHWQWPIQGKVLKTFSQTGGKGIDIDGKLGQKVRSAASGKIVYSGSGLKGYGNLLIIKHNYLYLSAYANNRRLLVKEGQHVKKGQVIAEVGRVGGKQTSLHFEIRKNGNPVNPVKYLPRK